MKRNNSIRLYNVLFPIWFLFLFPQLWLIIIPANFIVDSLVIYISSRDQMLESPLAIWKKHILPAWGIGFLSDIAGAALAVGLYFVWCLLDRDGIPITEFNPITFPGTTLIAIPGVILAGFLIYFLNKKLTFRNSQLEPQVIHRLCLHLALWTAPYTMLIPLYG